jgi:hypothetical protein
MVKEKVLEIAHSLTYATKHVLKTCKCDARDLVNPRPLSRMPILPSTFASQEPQHCISPATFTRALERFAWGTHRGGHQGRGAEAFKNVLFSDNGLSVTAALRNCSASFY